MGNRQVVERFARAMEGDDFDTQDALIHDDYVLDLPQSGERIRGRANRRAMIEHYPGRAEEGIRPSVDRVIGTDDRFVTSPFPTWNVIHLAGSGDEIQATGTIRYPDGKLWHFVALMTLREGKIWRETDYFGEPFEAPEWRSQYVERVEPSP
jgi:ketosteroid isomerase-like protein